MISEEEFNIINTDPVCHKLFKMLESCLRKNLELCAKKD